MNLTFDTVYQKLYIPIHRYLAKLVGDELADDLTQEVFISVNKNLHTLNEADRITPWVYRIASRHATDWFRSRNKHEINMSEMDFDNNWENRNTECISESELSESQNDSIKAIDQEWVAIEMHECIHAYVNRLPTHYRDVIVLSEFEGFKNREIAEILGVSLDTVKIRIHRARTRLKQEFQSGCHLYYDESCEFACEPKLSI
ncbi:MAG: RNA polymerase sigma factor [Methylobacter sp.]